MPTHLHFKKNIKKKVRLKDYKDYSQGCFRQNTKIPNEWFLHIPCHVAHGIVEETDVKNGEERNNQPRLLCIWLFSVNLCTSQTKRPLAANQLIILYVFESDIYSLSLVLLLPFGLTLHSMSYPYLFIFLIGRQKVVYR